LFSSFAPIVVAAEREMEEVEENTFVLALSLFTFFLLLLLLWM